MDDITVKKMVGHSLKDVHFDVYTHMTNEWLVNEIDKFEYK